jgi:hypothetical protein
MITWHSDEVHPPGEPLQHSLATVELSSQLLSLSLSLSLSLTRVSSLQTWRKSSEPSTTGKAGNSRNWGPAGDLHWIANAI